MSRKPIQRQPGLNISGSEGEAGTPMDFGTPPESSMQNPSDSFDSGLSGNSCRREGDDDSSTHENHQQPSLLHQNMEGGDSRNAFIIEEIVGIKQSLSDIGTTVKVLADQVTRLQRMVLPSSSATKSAEADVKVPRYPFTSGNQPDSPLSFPKNWERRRRSDSVLAACQRLKIRESWKLKSLTVAEDEEMTEELEELVGEKLSTREQRLRSSVKCSLPKFIEQTNWKFILPHLVSVDLSDKATTDYLLNETRTDQDKGVHFYLTVLPSKGDDAYCRFYRCLCDEKEHLGHKSLLQILNNE